MAVWRLQTTFQCDTAFPRDRICINPVFNQTLGGGELDDLCQDLVEGLKTITPSFTGEITCKAYDCEGSPPVYPAGQHTIQQGVVFNSTYPRELAVCMSFYSEHNRPRYRGRLYLPLFLTGGSLGLRPTGVSAKMTQLADLFEGLGGVDTDWSVYSQADGKARKVTHWWVDDEWDIQRSRGLRGSTRQTGTTSE